jgi:uncharacterized cupredoxin-like copper-binding protein
VSRLRLGAGAATAAVALVLSGCGASSSHSGNSVSVGVTGGGVTAGAQVIRIDVASSGFAFTKTSATANAGSVTLVSRNPQSISHDISIKGNGVSEQGNIVSNGGISRVTANLKAGTYTFYCSVDGHEAAGMKGTLTVK